MDFGVVELEVLQEAHSATMLDRRTRSLVRCGSLQLRPRVGLTSKPSMHLHRKFAIRDDRPLHSDW